MTTGICIDERGLTLTCDGDHGLVPPTVATFQHADGFIGQYRDAMKAGWKDTFARNRRVLYGPCCSGKIKQGEAAMTMTDDQIPPERMHRFTFLLDPEHATKLLKAAARRKLHPNRLASRLMLLITHDDLIDAVLDDGFGKPVSQPLAPGYQPRGAYGARPTPPTTGSGVMRSPI